MTKDMLRLNKKFFLVCLVFSSSDIEHELQFALRDLK